MIDIKQKSKQIEDQLQNVVSNKEGMRLLVPKIEELYNTLSRILDTCYETNSEL
jgi:hypothetical protein